MSPSTLVGRDTEVGVLGALVREVPHRGAAIVLRGDPGVGKSSLLGVAARQAADAGRSVLRVNGVQSEAQVPFSGLHRLLGPVLPGADALPTRQREALLSAFGLAEPPAESYLVSYAALELIADGAADVPVVLVVDDVQWLDPPSASALAFLARRIQYEPVVALFALRDGFDSPLADGSIPELVVRPLDERRSTELLDRHAADLPRAARRQILDLAEGNPLALVELPKSWSPVDGGTVGPGAMTTRLEDAFARRIKDLPDGVRLATLVVAANDTDELAEVVRATEALLGATRGEDLLARAVDDGVLVIDGPSVRFRHPLIRSACYQSALPSQRRDAHAAIADVLTVSPERRTWHRAAATVGPADDLADDLEAAADSALRRGSVPVAVAALTRAAHLSGSRRQRGRRLTAAAELAFEAGMYPQGVALLLQADPSDLAEEDRLRRSWLEEAFGDRTWSGAAKVPALCSVASRLAERGQREQALRIVLNLALRSWWSNPDDDTRRTLLDTAEGLGADPYDPTLIAILAYGVPIERGKVVAERLASFVPDSLEHPADALNLGSAATGIGAFPRAASLLDNEAPKFSAAPKRVAALG